MSRLHHQSRLSGKGEWVDPRSLPNYGSVADIAGNASDEIKQLTSNVLWSYGVGQEDGFAYDVCRHIKLLKINIETSENRMTATVVHELEAFEGNSFYVTSFAIDIKGFRHIPLFILVGMLNGAGVVHGGCFCTLVDL